VCVCMYVYVIKEQTMSCKLAGCTYVFPLCSATTVCSSCSAGILQLLYAHRRAEVLINLTKKITTYPKRKWLEWNGQM